MANPTIKVLEINNFDVFGKRFNGYSLQEYINLHPENNIRVDFIVNHKFSSDPNVTKLFPNSNFEKFDWEIEGIEQKLATKNQISISEIALSSHPAFKRANILHFHMYHNCLLPIEFLNRIPSDKKIILEFHDTFWMTDDKISMLDVFSYSEGPNKASLDAQRKRVLHSIDAEYIVHSPYLMNIAKCSSITKDLNLRLINFGINTNIFKPYQDNKSLRAKYKIPKDHIVLMCRAQKSSKGSDYILKALPLIKSSEKITLITVGTIGLFNSLKSKINVIDFGQVESEAKMSELYNLCDIFLSPSTEESFGFMAVEAMACSKPVIVFHGTALPDTTNAPEIGIATQKSTKELALAISSLINDPKARQSRGIAGRKYVQDRYAEQQYFNNYMSLFHELAKKGNRKTKKPPSSAPPSNLPHFKDILSSRNYQLEIIDYNNLHVQKALIKHNASLYHEIEDFTKTHPIQTFIKSNTPQLFKKIYNRIRKEKS